MKDEVAAIRARAGVIERKDVRILEVSGEDRVRYLNGMVSCDVANLSAGRGAMAVKPNNKGMVEALLRVRALDEVVRLDVREVVVNRVMTVLQKFIIMDDVTISDVSEKYDVIGVYGPGAKAALGNLDPGDLAPHAHILVGDVCVVRDPWLGVDGYELHAPAGEGHAVLAGLTADVVSSEAVEAVRIEAGVPVDGADLDDDTIALEARLEHAIDFEKGCYIGQETISRASNLGGIKHILVGFDVAGDEPPPVGAKVMSGDKQTGELTSVVRSPTLGRVIGLGFVHKTDEFVGNPVRLVADGDSWDATVAALPFVSV